MRQAISPDAKHIAVGVKLTGAIENIWVYGVEQGTRIPLIDPHTSYGPRWSPDGKQVAYKTLEGNTSELCVRASDGFAATRKIGETIAGGAVAVAAVDDWSPDGRYLAYNLAKSGGTKNGKNFVRVIPMAGAPKPLLEISDANGAKFSPDGNWIAYEELTTKQVYVTRFPGPGAPIAITTSGGADPRWRGDGQELFYISNDRTLFSVQVRETAREFQVLSSHPLFRFTLPDSSYDVTRDSKRFLVNTRTHREQSAALTIVTNWPSILQTH